jgi:CRP/FNR family transcriptional regulator, cyclic AMP receptor protein
VGLFIHTSHANNQCVHKDPQRHWGPGRAGTLRGVSDMLSLSAHLPEIELAPGEAVVTEGGSSGTVWVLVSGGLEVRKGDVPVNTIVLPGALIGEVSVLLGTRHAATVVATEASRLRVAEDGHAFLAEDPRITTLVAMGLAERLNFVTTYLADLKDQYGDAPGMAMVSDVLGRLSQRQAPAARPGSARDPDPQY